MSQVVSGALDRLHYEMDPCVKFDADKKLWTYLHMNKNQSEYFNGQEEDTESMKKFKAD